MWVGSALFFGAVVAPAAFGVLRSFALSNASEIAGTIVTRTLSVVNVTGFVVALFLLVSLYLQRSSYGQLGFILQAVLLAVIAAATGVGHWIIAARMRALRTAMMLPIDQVNPDDPRRIAFNNLHGYSVKVLGLAMIAALVAIVLISSRLKK
jgi:hypothetical protein